MLQHNYLFDSANVLNIPLENRDPLSIMGLLFTGSFCRDRFNFLNQYSPIRTINTVDPIPTPFTTSIAMSDLMDQTAIEIIKKANSGRIAISWSGGVDSTAVIVAFLRNLPSNEKDRLLIFANEYSILENQTFYKLLQKEKIPLIITENLIDDLREEEYSILTSGWCADQLFGSSVHVHDLSLYNQEPDKAFPILWNRTFKRSNLTTNSINTLVDLYKEYGKKLGVDIKQFCEVAWLHNFGIKWTFVKDLMEFKLFGSINEGKSIAFFSGLDFQRWSISHFDDIRKRNIYENPMYYKLPLKHYIYSYDNNDTYYTSKGKKNSWTTVIEEGVLKVKTDHGIKVFGAKNKNGELCPYCYSKVAKQVFNSFRK